MRWIRALADTGALLAVLDASDSWHARCSQALGDLRLPLVTSEAVLTELFHFVGDDRRRTEAAWSFIREATSVQPIGDEDLPALAALMARYHDRPMDLADATLVHLAGQLKIDAVFTVDLDDFETYRLDGKRRFRIVPGR